VVRIPLRAAGWALKFDPDVSSVQVELVSDVKVFLFFDLEHLTIVIRTLIGFLEMLDVGTRPLLVVLDWLDTVQQLLHFVFVCLS
jgi:hypothetical protein